MEFLEGGDVKDFKSGASRTVINITRSRVN